MATVQTLVNRAARLLGQIQPNTDLAADESADALVAVNAMLDTWRNDRLMCYALRDEAITLTNGTNPYTIGSGGNLSTDRPVQIENAYVLASNIRYAVQIITEEEYHAIPDPTTSASWPDRIWYQPSMSVGNLYNYPVSNGTAATLQVITRTPVLAFVALTDSVTLPPGWEEAITSNLALALAPEYNTMPSPMVLKMAKQSLNKLKTINSRRTPAYTELPLLVSTIHSANILANKP